MKYLQRLLGLFVISTVVFSCQKEYSVENGTITASVTAQWEFKENGVQFKGPIDTVSVDTISGYKFLTLNGRSDDGTTQITLQVFGADLKVGTYKTPFSLFAYIKGSTVIYQTNQSATDSFTITLSKVDTTGVTGTFSGKAMSGNASKTIVDGKFSAVIKRATTPSSADSGKVVLWSKAGCGGGTSTNPIAVSVGTKSGQITKFFTTEPTTCDPAGSFFLNLPVGSYPWVAKCGTDSVTGTFSVTKGGCTKVQVDFTTPTPAGDYFPTTTASNWSYIHAGGAADDTLFVYSTGNTKMFTGTAYNIFINDYGTPGFDTSYYRKGNGLYYEYYPASYNAFGLDSPATAVEHIFLKDNVAQGNTWTSSYNGTYNSIALTATINDTLAQKLTTYTVGGKSYPNVLEVHSGYYAVFPAPIGKQQLYLIKQWFAKGVGLIQYYQYDATNATDYTINITRAQVN